MKICTCLLLVLGSAICAEELPLIRTVEHQPLGAQVLRILDALDLAGEPLPAKEAAELKSLAAASTNAAKAVERIQQILDGHCLIGVHINPESRVKATQGPARPQLVQQGWRSFLVKVQNEAGVTPALVVTSPHAGRLAGSPAETVGRKFLEVQLVTKSPLKPLLSGLEVEYRILQLFSSESGKREAKLVFDIGQGTQDLGFRSEVDILFQIQPANKVVLRVLDEDGKPTTAGFLVRDAAGRVYPSQAKRLAGDFFFHPQIYRADGEHLLLPDGEYTIEYSRGPEYLKKTRKLRMSGEPAEVAVKLERWTDPSKRGWISGDHHIHAAGCSHYERPTEGVYPSDMMRHILGEDLKIGAVLTWGPGWYFQKTFFEGKEHALSTPEYRMRYDVEVSGFPSSHTGHIVLLGLTEQNYPKTQRIEDWPSWGVPVLRWAKSQGAITGFAHSGWGLGLTREALPSQEIPPFDGIGANEYIVSVTQDLVDFISTVDTPYAWELNIWYHTLNAGYRTRISGETDFPCIYDERVGLGRSYVKQTGAREYADWIAGIREGRNYVSDGKSHLMDFRVNGLDMGIKGSELKLQSPGKVRLTADVAALLEETPNEAVRGRRYDQKPYWDLERARIGSTRTVPVEVIVNGQVAAKREITADGALKSVEFDVPISISSWVALRILHSSHTNPVFVIVGDKPVRASKASLEWCLKAVDQCWQQKERRIRVEERGEAARVYEAARQAYKARLAETAAP